MKHLFKWAACAVVAVSLAACGGGGGSAGATSGSSGETSPLVSTAPSPVTIQVGAAQSYAVSGGSAPYTVVSDNNSVAVGSIAGNTLTIGAVSGGSATVSVIDAKSNRLAVSVTAQQLPMATNAPSAITLANFETSPVYTIRNGKAPYGVTSTNMNVVIAQQPTAGTFTITGANSGSASIIVSDSTGTTSTVTVTVAPPLNLFTTAPATLSLTVGNAPTYTISGGTSPYTVQSSNPNVATVSKSGNDFTITAVSNGTATIVVQDAAAKQATIAVTVAAQAITLNPEKATTIIGVTNYSYITGGVPPYTAVSTFAGLATVDIGTLDADGVTFHVNSSGNVLRMIANGAADPNQIVITDSLGNRGSFALTSNTGSTSFTFAPNELTVTACTASPFTLSVLGGSGTIRLFSSDTTQFTAAVSGTTVTITPVQAAPLVPGSYLFTAIDQNGATAHATVTVAAPAGGC